MTPVGANSTKAMHIRSTQGDIQRLRGPNFAHFWPPSTYIFTLNLDKNLQFLDHLPPLLVHVIIECPPKVFFYHYHEPIIVIWNSIVGVHTQCSFIETSSKRPLDYLLIMVRNFLIELVWTFSVISCICKVEPKSYWSRMRIYIFFRAWNKLNIQNVSKRYLEIV